MSFDVGPITNLPAVGGLAPPRRSAPAGFEAVLSAATTPPAAARAGMPDAVRDAVGVAADRADHLAAANRELHFETDAETRRVVVQVRDLGTGRVIRTIPPTDALAFLAGVA